MKTNVSLTSALLAAGIIGVALLTLAGFVSSATGFASLASIGILRLAHRDYSRPLHRLSTPAPVLRPVRPAETPAPHSAVRHAA